MSKNKIITMFVLMLISINSLGCMESTVNDVYRYPQIVVAGDVSYSYSTYQNQPFVCEYSFDITNIGNGNANNVQVDYSTWISGRQVDSGTLYVGSVSSGAYSNRHKSGYIELTDTEWKRLKNNMVDFDLRIDDVRHD